ncbi:MAG: hypothetical protein MZV70_11940 [Desulfobacterales bacterium]|nr:hypothetical protein [Desulfobacterales bacterium]
MARCFVLVFLLSVWVGCDAKREHTPRRPHDGDDLHRQGGHRSPSGPLPGLQEKIDRRLDEINRSMSPYLEDSEISRFNRFPAGRRASSRFRRISCG